MAVHTLIASLSPESALVNSRSRLHELDEKVLSHFPITPNYTLTIQRLILLLFTWSEFDQSRLKRATTQVTLKCMWPDFRPWCKYTVENNNSEKNSQKQMDAELNEMPNVLTS